MTGFRVEATIIDLHFVSLIDRRLHIILKRRDAQKDAGIVIAPGETELPSVKKRKSLS
jgi:hypothetical protein